MTPLFGLVFAILATVLCWAAVTVTRAARGWLDARALRRRGDGDTVEIVRRRPLVDLAGHVVLVLMLAVPCRTIASRGALPGPGAACMACGDHALRGPDQMRARGLHRSAYVFAMVGNSLTVGTHQNTPWPTRLATMLTKSGVSYTLTNLGHGGYATEYLADRANFSLTYKIPTEVDPLWDASKNNVLVLQEVINDLYYGATGAEAYANVRAYFQTTAKQWDYRVVVAPTPRDNPGVPVGYEAARQDFITLMAADPTFGGWVDDVWRVDQDPRLGDAADCANGYYYYISGGADTKVHWIDNAGAIAASSVMRLLRAKRPDHFPFIPNYAPYPTSLFSAATAGAVLKPGATPAADGDTAETWQDDGSLESGDLSRGGGAPLYETSGFGGNPSVVMAGTNSYFTAANLVSHGRGTFAITFKASAAGLGVWVDGCSGFCRVLLNPNNTETAKHAIGATNKTIRDLTPTLLGSVSHVLMFVFTGTSSEIEVYLDGVAVAGTTTNVGDPGDTINTGTLKVGHPGAAFTGEIGEVFTSRVPFNATERGELTTYLCALRGVTCS